MKQIAIGVCWLLSAHSLACAAEQPAALTPVGLNCEGRVDPLGIDLAAPRLGWRLEAGDSNARGLRQTAFHILAATSRATLDQDRGDLWDSGKLVSAVTNQVVYAGTPLRSSQPAFWKVRVWDQSGAPSAWSSVARWTMGVMTPADWKAHWITLDRSEDQSLLLRSQFTVKPGLVRAIVHVSGLGQYELRINGEKVGKDLLTPGWTNYRKACLYDTYDVTALLHSGPNAAGIVLGNGMYRVLPSPDRYTKFTGSFGPLKAIAQIELNYSDGSSEWIATNGSWKAHPGPIVYANVFGGEDHDARLYPKGWDQPGFIDDAWASAAETNGPGGALKGLSGAGWPIRAIDVLQPISQKEIRPGVTVYDLRQNAPLMPRITVSGPAGSRVKITPSELVKATGELDDTMTGGRAYWTYTLAGEGQETWLPQFFYRGARYLEIECTPAQAGGQLPQVINLEGVIVHADAPRIGRFSSSNDLFNRIDELVCWAQRSNLASVLTDCPHREKLGWLEQTHLNGPSLRYNFGLDPLFAKIVNDIQDAQQADGLVPNIAPEYVVFGYWQNVQFRESPEWGSAFIQVPWQQYLFSGDDTLIRRHYENMKRYLAYLGSHVRDGILHLPGSLGDWYDLGPNPPGPAQLTPVDLTATALYHDDVLLMAAMAEQLGSSEDAGRFRGLAARTRAAFDRAYLARDGNGYATGSQTANALPLALGMVAPQRRASVLSALVEDVKRRGLTAGDVGYRYVLRALSDGGRSDIVFSLNNQSDRPGYGYQLSKGATSLTEAWDAGRGSSQNHFMLGQITEWFYHDLAGIQCDRVAPGFREIIIKPAVVGDLTQVTASYDSISGTITSTWTREESKLTLSVTIPPNTTATIWVPAREAASVFEGGRRAGEALGVSRLRHEDHAEVFAVGSGTYTFRTTMP